MKTDRAVVYEIITEFHTPARAYMEDVLDGRELLPLSNAIKEEIAVDVFITDHDSGMARAVLDTYSSRFDFTEEELLAMSDWAEAFREGIFLSANSEERNALMPHNKDFKMYYTLRGPRPAFVKPSVSYWWLLHLLISWRHREERQRKESVIRSVRLKHSFKPTAFGFEVPDEIVKELKESGISYSDFHTSVTNKVLIPSVCVKIVTLLLQNYRRNNGEWPQNALECMGDTSCLDDTMRLLLGQREKHIKYLLNKRIETHLISGLIKIGGVKCLE